MELFHEVYGTYFYIVKKILEFAHCDGITTGQMHEIALKYGYEETPMQLLPLITGNEWGLLEERNGRYYSKFKNKDLSRPFSSLEKAWIKTILKDDRSGLFLSAGDKQALSEGLGDVKNIYNLKDFKYFDRAKDKDEYENEHYIEIFRAILTAIKEKKLLSVFYNSPRGREAYFTVIPWKLIYSSKDDKLRLLCGRRSEKKGIILRTLNLSRIVDIKITLIDIDAGDTSKIKELYKHSNKCKAVFEIMNERNAIERCMMVFAPYQKQTVYMAQTNTYICSIYYSKEDEMELLIKLLSFGPVIRLCEPVALLNEFKARVARQSNLLGYADI